MGSFKDMTMDKARKLDGNFVTAAWAAFFIWWGILELFEFLPKGTGAIGFGLILIGLNVARSLNGVSTSGFTTTVGLLALVLGGLELASTILLMPFDLPIFATLLITLGVILLANELRKSVSR